MSKILSIVFLIVLVLASAKSKSKSKSKSHLKGREEPLENTFIGPLPSDNTTNNVDNTSQDSNNTLVNNEENRDSFTSDSVNEEEDLNVDESKEFNTDENNNFENNDEFPLPPERLEDQGFRYFAVFFRPFCNYSIFNELYYT